MPENPLRWKDMEKFQFNGKTVRLQRLSHLAPVARLKSKLHFRVMEGTLQVNLVETEAEMREFVTVRYPRNPPTPKPPLPSVPTSGRHDGHEPAVHILPSPRHIDPDSALANLIAGKQQGPDEWWQGRSKKVLAEKKEEQEVVVREGFQWAAAWEYNAEKHEWNAAQMEMYIAEEPFAGGSTHEVFKATLLEGPNKTQVPYVAKLLNKQGEKDLITKVDDTDPEKLTVLMRNAMAEYAATTGSAEGIETEIINSIMTVNASMTKEQFVTWHGRLAVQRSIVKAHAFCHTTAKAFNEKSGVKPIKFLRTFLLVKMHDTTNYHVYVCQPFLALEAGKGDATHTAISEAFAHFSYEHSSGDFMIAYSQRLGDFFVDPQVYTASQNLGVTDLGSKGMKAFAKKHDCNQICEKLQLKKLPKPER